MKRFLYIFTLLFISFNSAFSHAFTKDEVVRRDHLLCGVSTGVPGFSSVDGKGNWSGIDVDVCRAVAAAVLGSAKKVKYVPLLPKERATALLAGDVDILARNLTWNLTRDSSQSMDFTAVTFLDLQGFIVAKRMNVKSILELQDFTVCLESGGRYAENLAEYLQESELTYKTIISDTVDQIVKDFEAGRCDVVSGGRAQLQGLRSILAQPGETIFLPEVITNLPLGPAVRQGDDGWFDTVKWVVFAMINGEELGLTSANIDTMVSSQNHAVKRFLGLEGIGGKGLGLTDGWAYQIIKQVGNYGESFERNLGESSSVE